jgi:hypothetical protein
MEVIYPLYGGTEWLVRRVARRSREARRAQQDNIFDPNRRGNLRPKTRNAKRQQRGFQLASIYDIAGTVLTHAAQMTAPGPGGVPVHPGLHRWFIDPTNPQRYENRIKLTKAVKRLWFKEDQRQIDRQRLTLILKEYKKKLNDDFWLFAAFGIDMGNGIFDKAFVPRFGGLGIDIDPAVGRVLPGFYDME